MNGKWMGKHVMGAGDVDGDGFDDVLVATSGDAVLYHGSAAGLQSSGWMSGGLGAVQGVASADVDADGYDDVILTWHTGVAEVYHGSDVGLAGTPAWTRQWPGPKLGDVSGAGDANGDGYGDVLMAAEKYRRSERVFGFYGSSTGLCDPPLADVTFRVSTGTIRSEAAEYLADPPVLGETWTATATLWNPYTHALVLGFDSSTTTSLPTGEVLLVSGRQVLRLPMKKGATVQWTAKIPNEAALCGETFYTQGAFLEFDPTTGVHCYLTNAQDLTFGLY